MTTTRNYTLPEDSVNCARIMTNSILLLAEKAKVDCTSLDLATAAITAFLDHMIESGDMVREDQQDGGNLYSMTLPVAEDTTT